MINCIVAVDLGHGIGCKGHMPWPTLTEDLAWFKRITTESVVIMGSATWRSIGRKLPGRVNIVISRSLTIESDHCYQSPQYAIAAAKILYPTKEIFIIGGQELYDSSLPFIDRFYVTEIHADFVCDRFFDLDHVQKYFPNVTTLADHYTSGITYSIKEYTK